MSNLKIAIGCGVGIGAVTAIQAIIYPPLAIKVVKFLGFSIKDEAWKIKLLRIAMLSYGAVSSITAAIHIKKQLDAIDKEEAEMRRPHPVYVPVPKFHTR